MKETLMIDTNWKETLRSFELAKRWDAAIEFMQHTLEQYPDDMDAHMYMNFLLMNLLSKERYNRDKLEEYWNLSQDYFEESYSKFSKNAEFLFFMGQTAFMSVWFFGIDMDDAQAMLDKAIDLEPHNELYLWSRYACLKFDEHTEEIMNYITRSLKPDSFVMKALATKGAMGAYLTRIFIGWTKLIQMK